MPYIRELERVQFNSALVMMRDALGFNPTPGQLNYVLTSLCHHYAGAYGHKYETFNDVIGVLECAKQEFYRRAVVPYEDQKIKQNGDVY